MKYIIPVLILALASTACKESIVYTGIDVPRRQALTGGEILNDSFLFAHPTTMIIVDSLLVVQDGDVRDTCFFVFNRHTGKYITGFGVKGRGPGEVLYPSRVNYNARDRAIVVLEANLRKIILYDMDKILSREEDFYSEVFYSEESIKSPNFIRDARPFRDTYIVQGKTDQARFGIMTRDGEIKVTYTGFLPLVADKEENWAIFSYASHWAIKPDQTKMVHATYIGGVMEIFDTGKEPFTLETARYFYKPVYKLAPGFTPKWVTLRDETIFGFEDLCVTDNLIYATVVGEAYPPDVTEPRDKLVAFDWQGIPRVQYTLPDGIVMMSCVVDEASKRVYMVVVENASREYLCSYNLE
jgi:hypothetical protein